MIEAFTRRRDPSDDEPVPTVATTTATVAAAVRDDLRDRPLVGRVGRLDAATRAEFRERGRTLTRVLLLQLRAADRRQRAHYARRAEALARAYGTDCAAHGIPIATALQVALAVRGYFLVAVRNAATSAALDADACVRAGDRAFDRVIAALTAELGGAGAQWSATIAPGAMQ